MDDTAPRLAFELGALTATAGAAQAAATAGVRLVDLVLRHLGCDWGDISGDDHDANTHALAAAGRIMSRFRLDPGGAEIWIITEADRSATTVLLPSEY